MTIQTIEQALMWIDEQVNPYLGPGYDRMKAALAYLGNPEKRFPPMIHVAGTNGKGSTTAFISHLLMIQGLCVGTFTSPHMMTFHERIAVNGVSISDDALLQLTQRMYELNQYMATTPYGRVTGFELYTVMMIVHFAHVQPDVCVVEVGVGGLWDCTNILDAAIAVITTVGIDHTERLGHTIEDIAEQKAGIIKPQSRVVMGALLPEAAQVVRAKAMSERATLWAWEQEFQASVSGIESPNQSVRPHAQAFTWVCESAGIRLNCEIQLQGAHQIRNASTALMALVAWQNYAGQPIDWEKARVALSQTRWIGRMETICQQPWIMLDGAHNIEGLTSVKQYIEMQLQAVEVHVLYAGLAKKQQQAHLALLASMPVERVFITTFDYEGAMSLETSRQITEDFLEFHIVPNWQEWLAEYCKENESNKQRVLIVTGSLYFISQVRAQMLAQ